MKKSIIALALAFSASAMAANPTANLVWSGFVPGSVAGDELVITGLAGQAIANGQLIVADDGTFTSTPVTLEARKFDDSTVGDLTNANWTLSSAQVSYSTGDAGAAKLVVKADGSDWSVGSVQSAKSTLNVSVAQDQVVDVAAGGSVQAQVTLVAEKV